MCDTILATPASSGPKLMLFGKNSDRERNEAQAVEYFAPADHEQGSQLACTYITIPQVRHTYALLLCRPFWMWGAEMGANEHGVVIGNEGLHARSVAPQSAALLGMDLLRLALERANTAAQAVTVITSLLEQYGQGGNCGHLRSNYYHNGFMIADATEAYVLETVGREWLTERVVGVRAMSNRYSIDRAVHSRSAGLLALIQGAGSSAQTDFSYADAIADPHREHIGNAGARRACSTALLRRDAGRLRVADMMSILRDHGCADGPDPQWRAECAVTRTVCMHAGSEDRHGQTVGSMISELGIGRAVHWVTGTAAPCISIFKPLFLDVPLPVHGPAPTDRFDPYTLWWRHERLHRWALRRDLGKFIEEIRAERDALEAQLRTRVQAVVGVASATERSRVVAECWQSAMQMEARWIERIENEPVGAPATALAEWDRMDRLAGVPSL